MLDDLRELITALDRRVPRLEATGELDIDQNPLMETQQTQVPVTDPETGEPVMTARREEYVEYLGPQAQCVDISHFFPDPLGDDVQNCRWVIHRVYRDRAHIQKLIDQGRVAVKNRIAELEGEFRATQAVAR